MTDAQIAAYYAKLLADHGPTYRAGDYGSAASQAVRLGALAEAILTDDSGKVLGTPSVLDVGCGVGDLKGYLPKTATYTGWDFSLPIIQAARTKWPGTTFEPQSLLTSTQAAIADYVFASGLFQFRGLAWLKKAVTRMYALANTTVAFNFLTTTTEPEETKQDALTVARFCKTLTPRVVVRMDYLPNDATVILFKD